MATVSDFVVQYVDAYVPNYEELQSRILDRVDNYGAYKYLRKKSMEDIKQYGLRQFRDVLSALYSTQRQKVYNDLESILTQGSGVAFFRGFVNGILQNRERDIDQLHANYRDQIKHYSRMIGSPTLGFGKNTISQIAHFCKPDVYPLSNTKSQDVVYHLYGVDVSDNYHEFKGIANGIVADLREYIEESLELNVELMFRDYMYVLLDDFVEFVYDIIKR